MQSALEYFQHSNQVGGDGLPGEIPDNGTQLVLGVETQAMVDQVELAGAFLKENVAAFAVRIIDQQVEQGHSRRCGRSEGFRVK